MNTQDMIKQTTSNTKIRILCYVFANPQGITVSKITKESEMQRSNISKQICEMKSSGLLISKPEGKLNYYFLNNDLIEEQVKALKSIVNSFNIVDEGNKDHKLYK